VTVLSPQSHWIKVKERVERMELSRKDPQTKCWWVYLFSDDAKPSSGFKSQDK
jgi:hypothetical protein